MVKEYSGWAGVSFRGERGSPQGPGAAFQNSGQSVTVTWRSLARCVGSRAAIARSPVGPPLFPGYQRLEARGTHRCPAVTASTEKDLPSPLPGQSGDRFPGTVGDSDWEGLSVCWSLPLPVFVLGCSSGGLLRGLGHTHGLLGPFRSVIPEGNYPCAFGRFLFHWTAVARYQNSTELWVTGNH